MISIDLSGNVAIVTGGAGGLGKAIALRLADAGSSVVVADLDYDNAKLVADEIKGKGVSSKAMKVDASNADDINNLVDTTVKEFGKVTIMINNAGIGIMKPILEFTKEDVDKMVDIDLKGVIYGCKAALKYMVQQKEGKVVNTSSVAAKMGTPGSAVYAAAKNGVIAITNSLAREMGEFNININAICPGIIRTQMWEDQLALMTEDGNEDAKSEAFTSFVNSVIPLKRPQEAVDVANMVVYLCSDLGKNITGQAINVCGGTLIC